MDRDVAKTLSMRGRRGEGGSKRLKVSDFPATLKHLPLGNGVIFLAGGGGGGGGGGVGGMLPRENFK